MSIANKRTKTVLKWLQITPYTIKKRLQGAATKDKILRLFHLKIHFNGNARRLPSTRSVKGSTP